MQAIFEFATDSRSEAFCRRIAKEMISEFGISEQEAIGRINRHWCGKSIVGPNVVYHETASDWANTIYYGHNSFWWLNPPGLKPLPYP